jgi:hypothetical protein
MITTPIYEDLDDEVINRDELKEFVKKYEKQIKSEDWKSIIKDLESSYGKDYGLVKSIFENILGENILTRIDYIPANFFKEDEITTLDIPSNITSIGDSAFRDCKKLQAVIIPDSVTSIGENVFSGCSSLKDLKLSEKIETIPNKAFSGCSALDYLYIPDSVKRLGYDVFSGCPDSMVVELNRGVNRAEDANDPHPNALKMKSSTHDFMAKHLKWKNA